MWLLSLVLDVIAKHFEEIDVGIGNNIKNLIYIYIYIYMFAFIFASLIPYIFLIARFITKVIFGLVNKPLIEHLQNKVDRILNVKTLRLLLYLMAFMIYFANIVVKFETNKSFEIIREGMLSWIILDVCFFSIFDFIENKKNKKIKMERLKFQRLLMKFVNESILEMNKYELFYHFQELEKTVDFKQIYGKNKKMAANLLEYYNSFFIAIIS